MVEGKLGRGGRREDLQNLYHLQAAASSTDSSIGLPMIKRIPSLSIEANRTEVDMDSTPGQFRDKRVRLLHDAKKSI